MSDISPSSIKTDTVLEEKLKSASFEEIKVIMANAAIKQGLVVPDIYDNSVLIPTEKATQPPPQRYAKSITVNDEKHILEANSELGLAQAETAFFRELMQTRESTEAAAPAAQPRNNNGQLTREQGAVDEAEILRQSDLELRWKRGEISSDVYLAESGSLRRALEAQGIDMAALQEVSGRKTMENWQAASEEYLRSTDGASWPGGEANKRKLGEVLIAMHAEDSPSAENIRRAAEYLRENNLLESNPEVEAHERISQATSFEDIRNQASSLFGRR